MALTRDYTETVMARIRRDREFARALYAEAMSAFMTRLAGKQRRGF
ncbi:MAG: hypothetical protein ABSD29_02655 [Verrucomicrobiota bacterium]|jgi:hypothetical protein